MLPSKKIDVNKEVTLQENSIDYLLKHWNGDTPVDPIQILRTLGGRIRVIGGDRDAYYPGMGSTLFVSKIIKEDYPSWSSRVVIARELQFLARRMNSMNLTPTDSAIIRMTKMARRTLLPLEEIGSRIQKFNSIEAISKEFQCPLPELTLYLMHYIEKGQLPAFQK